MATVVVTLNNSCGGQGHAHLTTTVNGGAARSTTIHVDEMLTPLTEEEREIVLRGLLRIHAIGRTRAQMRSDLIAGITMTV